MRAPAAAVLVALAATVVSGAAETVTGEIVSVGCYLQNRANVGRTGYVCAIADVKWEGNPPGLLTPDGKLYQLAGGILAGNNARVVPHLGHIVTITGDVTVKDGMRILAATDLKMQSPGDGHLETPNALGVTMGHLHLNVRDVEANRKFFALLGGNALRIDGTDVMRFPGVLIFLTHGTPPLPGPRRTEVFCGCPADGLEASLVNHIGFNVANYDEFFSRFKTAGYRMEDFHGARGRTFLVSPDGLVLEIAQSRALSAGAGEMHLHTFVSDMPPKDRDHQVVPFEMYLWYARMFGATLMPGGPGSGLGADLPGVRLRISQTRLPIEPTKGRVLDHVGLEVRDLEAFCRQLEANGVKLTEPYSTTRHRGFASAALIDPWGVSIELTEGLSRF